MKIYTYIYHVNLRPIILFSIHIFIQYDIICQFAPFPTFILTTLYAVLNIKNIYKHLSEFNFHNIVLIQKVSKSNHGVSCMHG